ncbi:MAG TPA: hypothetical protein PKV58_08605 [Kaistella sp.]|jgi:hypothetical protein|nr:hypothetical protein [Kaistella sp.]HPZ25969.1 hypothetical protein [Kaistella sp.]HQD44911.1 hypothetical protein [Kaistella sp.]
MFPFSLVRNYQTDLSFEEILERLENNETEYYFNGLQVVNYGFEATRKKIIIQRYSEGIDPVIEFFPLIKMEIQHETPIKLKIKYVLPYKPIIFFTVFVIPFIFGTVREVEWTVNDVKRLLTLPERAILFLIMVVLPGLWCYLQFLRPINKMEKWLMKKLDLYKIKNV